ncbi:CPBP family intramembrane glutamic endopeptidase [Geodermatophilus sp. SYSU D00696]
MTSDVSGPVVEDPPGARRLSVAGWIALLIVYLVLLQGLAVLLTRGTDAGYASPTTPDEVWRSITAPVGVSLAFVLAAVALLRWWRPVLVDARPVQRWVVVVPVLMGAGTVAAVNYGGLADRGLGFTLLLLLSCLLVGSAEEGMFRGLGVTVFRTNGFSEGRVALWSTLVFGLAHATNLVSEGVGAFVQVFVTAVAGYFFYLVRRRAGGLLAPALLHGLWDFALVSSAVVPGRTHAGFLVAVLVMVVLGVLLWVRRHRIEPAPTG